MSSSLSSLGLGLSVVFVCLLLALIAEIYYLLWWKKRLIRRDIEDTHDHYNTNHHQARDYLLFYMLCMKKKPLVNPTNAPPQTLHSSEFQFHKDDHNENNYMMKPVDENGGGVISLDEPGLLITGPPRFLFTIKEETKEDLESEDGRSFKKRSSLSELLNTMENNASTSTPPYLTPFSSPPFVTPPVTPMGSCHSSQSGSCNYNPFYEASSDAEFSRMVKCSPPPKFKFLRDAEEKLRRKTMLMEEALKKSGTNLANKSSYSSNGEEEQDGSFITVIVADSNKNQRECYEANHHHYHSPSCSSSLDMMNNSRVP